MRSAIQWCMPRLSEDPTCMGFRIVLLVAQYVVHELIGVPVKLAAISTLFSPSLGSLSLVCLKVAPMRTLPSLDVCVDAMSVLYAQTVSVKRRLLSCTHRYYLKFGCKVGCTRIIFFRVIIVGRQ